jgi:glutaredoxin
MSAPKIILYTNRLCPWAHRAHIALKELGLDFEEVTIDLNTPREPWYLEINPVSDSVLPNTHSFTNPPTLHTTNHTL